MLTQTPYNLSTGRGTMYTKHFNFPPTRLTLYGLSIKGSKARSRLITGRKSVTPIAESIPNNPDNKTKHSLPHHFTGHLYIYKHHRIQFQRIKYPQNTLLKS